MRSMEERIRRRAASATNPQRRPVLTSGGRQPRADEGNADGSGAAFQHYRFNGYRALGDEPSSMRGDRIRAGGDHRSKSRVSRDCPGRQDLLLRSANLACKSANLICGAAHFLQYRKELSHEP